MFKNLRLSVKLIVGFLAVSLITFIVGIVGIVGLQRTMVIADDISANMMGGEVALWNIRGALADVKAAERTLLLPGVDSARIDRQYNFIEGGLAQIEQGWKKYESLPKTPEEVAAWKNFVVTAEQWKKEFQEFLRIVKAARSTQNKEDSERGLEKAKKQSLDVAAKLVRESTALLDKTIEMQNNASREDNREMARVKALSVSFMIIAIIVGVSLALLLGIALSVGITRPINKVVRELSAGAAQSASAASAISSASQQLSQGATEQASSLEETASSLDQINTMTRQNADNASKANQLAQEARTGADEGNRAMNDMQSAMAEINSSSDKISKIIKTIEEISFQTNLLALNAAVEAARAGEHGKGFAVVADEVRNLAQRAASAARDTAGLIEDNVTKTKNGAEIAKKAGSSLQKIMENTKKVADIISEIATASKEQTDGLQQITTTVTQIDQVTQRNAAASEESASSAEELSSQAETLQDLVGALRQVVGGALNGGHSRKPTHLLERRNTVIADMLQNKSGLAGAGRSSSASPEDVIPLNEKETQGLKDF